ALPALLHALPDVPSRTSAGARLAGCVLALPSIPYHGGSIMSAMTAPAPTNAPQIARPLVEVRNLGRVFDVSKHWLNRVTEALPRHCGGAAARRRHRAERGRHRQAGRRPA